MLRHCKLAAMICVAFVCAPIGYARAQEAEAWMANARSIAERVDREHLVVTDSTRRARERAALRAHGEARLARLYDLAADDFVASDKDMAARSLAALERDANAQESARYVKMAGVLRAYAPALDGEYVKARRELSAVLENEDDPQVMAAGSRLMAYVLTDLGLFGNALEAARAGLVRLPTGVATLALRSGLYDAMAYNSLSIGDYATTVDHMQRTLDLDMAAGRPIDGLTHVHNITIMLARAGDAEGSFALARLHTRLTMESPSPAELFFTKLLCARVHFSAGDYATAATCAREGRAVTGAPGEYLPRLLTLQTRALARLGRGREARAVMDDLHALNARRGDPSLDEELTLIEPEVLNAQGRYREAFKALLAAHETSEKNMMQRFGDGARELRAAMENEVAEAEQQAQAEALRAELQARRAGAVSLLAILAGVCFVAVGIITLLIYRSRRAMLDVVARAEEIQARQLREGEQAAVDIAHTSSTERLKRILGDIERHDREMQRAFAEVEAARAEAEEANRVKSQFLATMTHELRTPLNAIIGYSEILMESADERGDDHDQADLGRISRSAHHLLAIVNDVLDLSKIEAGRMAIEYDTIDLAELAREALALVAPVAEANGNEIIVDLADIGEAETDGVKLSQCLLNLLSNAAKFTKNGTITLRGVREIANGVDMAVLDVADTGIGIPPEVQARLFQPFEQADSTITRAYGGTGLGLAITRKIAIGLGGDVSLVSEAGRGSTFTLRIPMRPQAPPALARAAA